MSALISGCSTVENTEIYQDWQKQAYSVYKMPIPQKDINQLPVTLDPNTPQKSWVYLPQYGKVSQPQAKLTYLSDTEQRYIANHYGL